MGMVLAPVHRMLLKGHRWSSCNLLNDIHYMEELLLLHLLHKILIACNLKEVGLEEWRCESPAHRKRHRMDPDRVRGGLSHLRLQSRLRYVGEGGIATAHVRSILGNIGHR